MQLRQQANSKGFVLIACLLLLLLISALSIGLLIRVRTEASVGNNDLHHNVAFHGAEGAMEKMTSDLSNMFLNIQAPQVSDYTALSELKPTIDGITLTEYSITPTTDENGKIKSSYGQITTGPNQGLYAQLIPVTLAATAQSGLSNQVRMLRTAQVALIPIFQFGVFSQGDLGFFSSPDLDFNGRVHTNGDLYLGVANSYTVTFHDKITAYGNVIRKVLPNGLDATNSSFNDQGTVKILAAAGGCDGSRPSCKSLTQSQGSVVGGPTSAQNTSWSTISKSTYNGWIVNGNYGASTGTGATCLSLPFTTGQMNCPSGPGQAPSSSGAQPYEIVRRPPIGESLSSAVGQARLYNQAQIRVLLADDPAENHLDGSNIDGEDIRLANVQTNSGAPDYSGGVPIDGVGNTFFAEGTSSNANINEPHWQLPGADAGLKCYPSASPCAAPQKDSTNWNLIDGYLRIEYRDSNGAWHAVTKEWLVRGFARGIDPPASSDVHPKAILVFQQLADRDGDGTLTKYQPEKDITDVGSWSSCRTSAPSPPSGYDSCDAPESTPSGCFSGKKKYRYTCYKTNPAIPGELWTDSSTNTEITGSETSNNWYPINMYDAREGEVRDNLSSPSSGSCAVNGVMNLVELDVANLKAWLADSAGHGPDVDYVKDNGYILYFSDRRGMGLNPNVIPSRKTGDSGLEDSINLSSGTNGTPDGVLESPGDRRSPEDVNLNGVIDKFGPANMGLGVGLNASINSDISKRDPYKRISNCVNIARPNWVSGARHGLRLVNGGLGDVPMQPSDTGGFTVASENPVYILGDYNSDSGQESTWNDAETTPPTGEAASSVIADAVTVLSNNWINGGDVRSMKYPFDAPSRVANTTHYRVAIAAGKNRTFNSPSWSQTGILYGYGTDGGLHNFLRFLEDWTNKDLYYKGSLVSLFYSTYATGTFKCCNKAAYHPPERHYAFDTLFANPANLPPGTPMFRDVDNLSYRQDLTPR